MPLAPPAEVSELYRCPRTGRPLQADGAGWLISEGEGEAPRYALLSDTPFLVDFDRSVLDEEETLATHGASKVERQDYRGAAGMVKSLLSPEKDGTQYNVARFIDAVKERAERPRILVIGGGSIGRGLAPIYDEPDLSVVAFDIYASPYTQFVGDAHAIPLADEAFDGVVIQAVLEHVLEPWRVAGEIERVLKPGGVVYAETPFMQQVHEGAYDFTRFTESGHRYLFRRFETLASGSNGGPGLQFMWSADYLARSVFRSRAAGKAAKLLFFWTQYLDRLVPETYAVDGASGVYFLGRKTGTDFGPKDAVRHYRGAQRAPS